MSAHDIVGLQAAKDLLKLQDDERKDEIKRLVDSYTKRLDLMVAGLVNSKGNKSVTTIVSDAVLYLNEIDIVVKNAINKTFE